jgi:hypothetical protein
VAVDMKTACRSEAAKWGLIAAGALMIWAPVASKAINTVAPATAAASEDAPGVQNAPAAQFSAGVGDILKMVEAKVDPEVIKAYISSSPIAYNPSAAEIIALKDRGVGSEILTAMLQHGAEVRAQAMRAAPQAAPGGVNPYAPAYDYSAQPAYPAYTYAYPAASYVYPTYSYGYPGYYYGGYGCGYSWPWYWPSLYFGGCSYGGYCGHPYSSCGYRYPYGYGGRGYGYYHGRPGYYGGGHGYYGGRSYYGGHGYNGSGARPVPYAGRGAGFSSVGGGGRPATFASPSGGFRAGGGGHAVSFGGHGGSFGGHSMGRSR